MARAGRIADSLVLPWLDQMAATAQWVSLLSGDPFSVGNPNTLEPSGAGYARQTVTFARTGRLLRNANLLLWTGLPIGTVATWIAGFDAQTNGNLTFAAPMTRKDWPLGGSYSLGANQLMVGMDA